MTVEPRHIHVRAGAALLDGDLWLPDRPRGLVVLAHAAGRLRPDGLSTSGRSDHVARALRGEGYATLGVDLLTPTEEVADLRASGLRADVDALSDRLSGLVESCGRHPSTDALQLGLVAWGPVGAAALRTAADLPQAVRAVVVGGRQLVFARDVLHRVLAGALVLLGDREDDEDGVRSLADGLGGPHHVAVIPDADELFAGLEPLDRVAALTCAWMERYVATHVSASPSPFGPAP